MSGQYLGDLAEAVANLSGDGMLDRSSSSEQSESESDSDSNSNHAHWKQQQYFAPDLELDRRDLSDNEDDEEVEHDDEKISSLLLQSLAAYEQVLGITQHVDVTEHAAEAELDTAAAAAAAEAAEAAEAAGLQTTSTSTSASISTATSTSTAAAARERARTLHDQQRQSTGELLSFLSTCFREHRSQSISAEADLPKPYSVQPDVVAELRRSQRKPVPANIILPRTAPILRTAFDADAMSSSAVTPTSSVSDSENHPKALSTFSSSSSAEQPAPDYVPSSAAIASYGASDAYVTLCGSTSDSTLSSAVYAQHLCTSPSSNSPGASTSTATSPPGSAAAAASAAASSASPTAYHLVGGYDAGGTEYGSASVAAFVRPPAASAAYLTPRETSAIIEREESALAGRQWNAEFQTLLELPNGLSKFKQLRNLARDFVYCAQSYGRIIISEHCLPHERKTLKPVNVGGVAGGEKYICQGILFKFAIDFQGLYQGDENAMKAASHDLKGLMNYTESGVDKICYPMMAIIDYRGFRLMALSLLPIDGSTLIYGSADAGRTVFNSDPELNALMKLGAERLNLKPHLCGPNKTEICGPADIEVHLGRDQRYYMLDFARLSPPQPPLVQGDQLYKLFRYEFVRAYKIPLCCDAFSAMGRHNYREHCAEVREAFRHYQMEVIPAFVARMDTERFSGSSSSVMKVADLLSEVHKAGINYRHLGFVRALSTNHHLKLVLLLECAARTMKSQLQLLLREKMKTTGVPSDEPYRRIYLEFFNVCCAPSSSVEFESYWGTHFPRSLIAKYPGIISAEETKDWRALRSALHTNSLITRVADLSHIVLAPQALHELSLSLDSQLERGFEFVDPDLEALNTRVIHTNFISYADGMALFYEAMTSRSSSPGTRERLLRLSKDRLMESITSIGSNATVTFQLANVYREMGIHLTMGSSTDRAKIFEKAIELYNKARTLDQSLAFPTLLMIGRCYRHASTGSSDSFLKDSEQVLLEAIELEPDSCTARYQIARTCYEMAQKRDVYPEDVKELIQHLARGKEHLEVALAFSSQYRKAVFWMAKFYQCEAQLWLIANEHHTRLEASAQTSTFYGRALELHPAYYETIFPQQLTENPLVLWRTLATCFASPTLMANYAVLVKDLTTFTLKESGSGLAPDMLLALLNAAPIRKLTIHKLDDLEEASLMKTLLKAHCDLDLLSLVGFDEFTDEQACCLLDHFSSLRKFSCANARLSLATLSYMTSKHQVRHVNLERNAHLSLESLQQSDASCFSCLRSLNLNQSGGFSEHTLNLLASNTPTLRSLRIQQCEALNDELLPKLLSRWPALEVLDVKGSLVSLAFLYSACTPENHLCKVVGSGGELILFTGSEPLKSVITLRLGTHLPQLSVATETDGQILEYFNMAPRGMTQRTAVLSYNMESPLFKFAREAISQRGGPTRRQMATISILHSQLVNCHLSEADHSQLLFSTGTNQLRLQTPRTTTFGILPYAVRGFAQRVGSNRLDMGFARQTPNSKSGQKQIGPEFLKVHWVYGNAPYAQCSFSVPPRTSITGILLPICFYAANLHTDQFLH